jgi:Uma2 family endonuclease
MIEAGILRDRHVELLKGEIIQMAPEEPLHRYINVTLAEYLRSCLGSNALVYEAHPITLSDSEPQPDLAIIKPPHSRYSSRHPNPEDIYWLIEISDTTVAYDLREKQQAYAQAKIAEYWVVNLKAKKLIIFQQPQGESYLQQQEYPEGIVSPQAFDFVEIKIDKLWAN